MHVSIDTTTVCYLLQTCLNTKCDTDVAASDEKQDNLEPGPSATPEVFNTSCEVLGCSPVKATKRN
jgi:hypothetical protein